MKRKTVVVLLTGAMTVAAAGSSAQAMTYGYSREGKNGTVSYYISEMAVGGDILSLDVAGEAEAADEVLTSLPEAEKEKLAQWHKTEMKESLAYLKDYGVTYDGEQDVIWYQGKKVRWLIDPQINDGCRAFEMPDGEIDVYTVRDENFQLTGVRTATQEEFDERTRQDALEEELSKNGVIEVTLVEGLDPVEVSGENDGSVIYSISAAENAEPVEDAVISYEGIKESQTETVQDRPVYNFSVEAAEVREGQTETAQDGSAYDFSVEAVEAGDTAVEAEYLEETKEKRAEYKAVGIGCDEKTGCWTWKGKKIFWLVDEDGGMYQNGEARDDKIYILVKRNEDGSIKEAKQITAEEVMAERIWRLEKEAEDGQQ